MGLKALVKEVLVEWYENRITWCKKHKSGLLIWGVFGMCAIIGIIVWIIGYR